VLKSYSPQARTADLANLLGELEQRLNLTAPLR
jgi:hypothetical protein